MLFPRALSLSVRVGVLEILVGSKLAVIPKDPIGLGARDTNRDPQEAIKEQQEGPKDL